MNFKMRQFILMICCALPMFTIGQTVSGAGVPTPIPATGTGGFPCAGGPTLSTAASTVMGTIGTTKGIGNVTINLTHTWNSDLDIFLIAPNGTRVELSTDNGGSTDNYTNTVFSDNAATAITAGTGPFTGTFRPEQPLNTTTAGAPTNGNWQLEICDDAGGDSGTLLSWSITFVDLCAITGPASPLMVDADPTMCGANVSLVVTAPACTDPITNDFNAGGADASGVYPVGTTTVTFTSGLAQYVVDVVVSDVTGPVLDCPNTLTFDLDAGECNVVVNTATDITATDNCGTITATFPTPPPIMGTLNTLTTGGNGGAANGAVYFDIVNNTANDLSITGFMMNITANTLVNVYTSATYVGNAANAGAWTLAGQADASTGAVSGPFPGNGTLTMATLATPIVIPPGTTGIALNTISAANNYTNGNGANQTYSDAFITLNLGSASNTLFGGTFNPRVFNGAVSYSYDPFPQITQVQGLPAGSLHPVGTTPYVYVATDADGNTSSCAFDVVVNEFPRALQTKNLACNDQVNISVDESCEVAVTADMILEGGLYGCYDNYNIRVEGIVPANAVTGNNTSAATINAQRIPAFAANGMAGTYRVSVIDPINNNSCWGYLMLEDKLAPTITCEDVTISCISSTAPAQPVTGSIAFADADPGVQWGAMQTAVLVGEYEIPMAAPAGALITDINVGLTMDHTWISDVRIELTGPDGTVVNLFNQACGANDNLDVVFDSEATSGPACATCASGGVSEDCEDPALYLNCATATGSILPSDALSAFYGKKATGTWTLRFYDSFLGDGGCVKNISVDVDYIINAAIPAVAMDNCTPLNNIPFSDRVENRNCETGIDRIITRSWSATDAKGNKSDVCVQTITVEAISIDDVPLPPAIVDLPCGAGDFSPAAIAAAYDNPITRDVNGTPIIENNEGIPFAMPHYFAGVHAQPIPASGLCGIYADYKDHTIDACGAHCHGNKKILRTWKLLNWCDQTFAEYVQIIRAKDQEAPTFLVKDTTVSTRPWDCTGDFMLPDVWELHDNCDINPTYEVSGPVGVQILPKAGGGWRAVGAPKGVHTFTYTAYDCCGNSSSQDVTVTVLDKMVPVVTTKRDIVVSLTPSYDIPDSAQAKLFCSHIDNGSFDACTPVYCEIRRPMGSPSCGNLGINGHNNNMTFNNTAVRFGGENHPDDNANDTDNGEFVKFCCADLNAIEGDANEDGVVDDKDRGYVKVIIRVWDDANMSGVYGDLASPFPGVAPQRDNFNEGWAWVKVECKTIPIITCPPADTAKCYWDVNFDPSAGWRKVADVDLSKTGIATAFGCCGDVEVEFSDAGNIQECKAGTFIRTFRAGYTNIDGKQAYVMCTQPITILPDVYPVSVREYTGPVRKNSGCTFDPTSAEGQGHINAMRPTINGGPCDVIGENIKIDTFLFESGVCKKWRITYEYWNWCKEESYGPFVEYVLFEDKDKPVIMNCQDTCISVNANCEATITLENSAFDISECTDDEWIKWICEIDMWGDGTIDYVAATHFTERNWTPAQDAWYGSYLRINLPATSSKDSPNAIPTGDQIAKVTIPEIVSGKQSIHKVTWKAIDGCHNESGCAMVVTVMDKKAPTPYCVSLSSALMEDGSVELWAKDFDKGSFDNCTEQDDLLFTFNGMAGAFADTIIRVGTRNYAVNADIPQFFDANGFVAFDGDGVITDVNGNIIPAASNAVLDRYAKGDIQRWKPAYKSSAKVFDCDEYNAQGPNGVQVNMSVWDKKFNTDYCVVYLSLVDNQGACDGNSRASIAGRILTESGEELSEVTVTIEGDVNDLTRVATVNGGYDFNNLDLNVDYELVADKDMDYMNGVSTLDLVLIQRHILGNQPLTNGLKLIAADVNGDRAVRANDLVELRKLILGLNDKFTAPSWQLIDAKEYVSMTTPIEFTKVIYVDNLTSSVSNADFTAVKVGDVNGNAKANVRSNSVEPRSANTLVLNVDDRNVTAGEVVSVAVTSNNFASVAGYQFTTELNGLILSNVIKGAIDMSSDNVGVLSNNVMTASWAPATLATVVEGDVLFTLEFTATKSGKLSEMMALSSKVTKAESYIGSEVTVGDVELSFRTEANETAQYALYQNEPNPFKVTTTVAYEMAEAGVAKFTLYDVAGKVIMTRDVTSVKGLNTIEFTKSDVNVSGIVYYQIETGDFTATKTMIVVE